MELGYLQKRITASLLRASPAKNSDGLWVDRWGHFVRNTSLLAPVLWVFRSHFKFRIAIHSLAAKTMPSHASTREINDL